MGALRGRGLAIAGIVLGILGTLSWIGSCGSGRYYRRGYYRTYRRYSEVDLNKIKQQQQALNQQQRVAKSQLARMAEASRAIAL
jgi:hypothetical protein